MSKTPARARVIDLVLGGLIGAAVGVVVAMNLVIYSGVDRG